MPLRRPGQPVGIVQAGIKPLGAIGSGHLIGQHVTHLVMEGGRVIGGLKVAVIFAPECPAAGQSVEHLPGIAFRSKHRLSGGVQDRRPILMHLRHARFPKILLGQDVDGELRPMLRHSDPV